MASKRHKKRKHEAWKNRVHGGKKAYDSPQVAELTLKRVGDSALTLYHCPFCRKFHVGRIKEFGRPYAGSA